MFVNNFERRIFDDEGRRIFDDFVVAACVDLFISVLRLFAFSALHSFNFSPVSCACNLQN